MVILACDLKYPHVEYTEESGVYRADVCFNLYKTEHKTNML